MVQPPRRTSVCWLIEAFVFCACDQVPPPVTPEPQPQAEPAATRFLPQEVPTSRKVPWPSQIEQQWAPVVMSKPVVMAPGLRCVTYRTLPFVDVLRNTLIEDACLEIPSNTTVSIQSGVTLAIVATNGFRLGRNVTFSANGTRGHRGDRADFESIRYTPNSDAEINATCVDNGNLCACPTNDSNAAIRGHTGANGSPGAFVRLLVGEFTSGSQLKGLTIDVSGGDGGPPGESGKRDCLRGTTRCSSTVCSDGAKRGARGSDGHVTVSFVGTMPALLLQTLRGATTPSNAITVIPLSSAVALRSEVEALNEDAFNRYWDRQSGQEMY